MVYFPSAWVKVIKDPDALTKQTGTSDYKNFNMAKNTASKKDFQFLDLGITNICNINYR